MDIAKIAPSNYPHRLVHPSTGRYLGLTIELAHISDPRFKAVERQLTDKALTKRARGKIPKAEELDDNRIRLLATVILGFVWENDADGKPGQFSGEQLAFNAENVGKLLSIDWIRDQIDEALAEQSNFFKG